MGIPQIIKLEILSNNTQIGCLSIKGLFLSMVMNKTVRKHGMDVSLLCEGEDPANGIPLGGPCVLPLDPSDNLEQSLPPRGCLA